MTGRTGKLAGGAGVPEVALELRIAPLGRH